MVKGRPVTLSRVEDVRDLVARPGELDPGTREAVCRDLAQLLDLAATAPQRTEVRRRGSVCAHHHWTALLCNLAAAAQING